MSLEYQRWINKTPGLFEAIKRQQGRKLESAGLLHLSNADLYALITMRDRIFQAVSVEGCAALARGQTPEHAWFSEVMNKIAESDRSFLSGWFDLQKKALIEAVKAPGPPAPLAAGTEDRDRKLLLDQMVPAERARFIDISTRLAKGEPSVSSEDACWWSRALLVHLRKLGETAGSQVARTLIATGQEAGFMK